MPNRALKTNLDLIKFYHSRYRYFVTHKYQTTKHGIKITDELIQVTLRRLLELMDNEWKDIFSE